MAETYHGGGDVEAGSIDSVIPENKEYVLNGMYPEYEVRDDWLNVTCAFCHRRFHLRASRVRKENFCCVDHYTLHHTGHEVRK